MENFIGKDGFVWFYGVVEDNNDPAKLGRAKVRIFGWHTDNLKELPTSDLPWAQPLNPPNNSKSFSAPRLGDYVMGFFSDGMSGQAPVLMGVFPGLEVLPNKGKGFSPQSSLPQATPPAGQVQYEPGKPTLAPLSRGIVANTAISQSNKNLAHVCDLPNSVKYEIAKLTISVSGLINTIRTQIQALWESTKSSPFGDEVRNAIKTIQAKVKVIQKFLRDNLGPQSDIAKFIQSLQELIVFITTLPARIAAMLQQCLSDATKGLKEAIDLGSSIQSQIEVGNILSADVDVVLKEALSIDVTPVTKTIQKP
jgi:hypothetical protein